MRSEEARRSQTCRDVGVVKSAQIIIAEALDFEFHHITRCRATMDGARDMALRFVSVPDLGGASLRIRLGANNSAKLTHKKTNISPAVRLRPVAPLLL